MKSPVPVTKQPVSSATPPLERSSPDEGELAKKADEVAEKSKDKTKFEDIAEMGDEENDEEHDVE